MKKKKTKNNSKPHNLSLEETKKIKEEVHSNNNIDNDNDNNNMNQDLNSQSQNESSDDKMIIKKSEKEDSNKSSGFNIISD